MAPRFVLVLGAPECAGELQRLLPSSQVLSIPSFGEFQQAIQIPPLKEVSPVSVAWVVSDRTVPTGNLDFTGFMSTLAPKLAVSNHPVLVLVHQPEGKAVVSRFPSLHALTEPYTATQVAAALQQLYGLEVRPAAGDGWVDVEVPSGTPDPAGPPPPGPQAGPPSFPPPQGPPAPWSPPPAPSPDTPSFPPPGQAPSFPPPQTGFPPPVPTAPAPGPTPSFPAPQPGFPPPAGQSRRGLVLAVTAPKGGTGKSSLSLNLAVHLGLRLAPAGRRVAIVDANVQQADLGKQLAAFHPNIADLVEFQDRLSPDIVHSRMIHRPQLGISALLGPEDPAKANPLAVSPELYLAVTNILREMFDYVVVDSPVAELYHDLFDRYILPAADFLIVSVAPATVTVLNTKAWLYQITSPNRPPSLRVDPNRVGLVLNRLEEGIGLDEDRLREDLASWRILGRIPEVKEWKRSMNLTEVLAARNFREMERTFDEILWQVTGEQVFQATRPDGNGEPAPSTSWLRRLSGLFKKREV